MSNPKPTKKNISFKKKENKENPLKHKYITKTPSKN